MISAYYRRLTGEDEAVKAKCATAWSTWEMATSRLKLDPEYLKRAAVDKWAQQFARIEWLLVIFYLFIIFFPFIY